MATWRYLTYSILEAVKETIDDADIKRNTIVFWLQVEANRLRQERLAKRKIQSGEYLSHIGDIPVSVDGMRRYVSMPSAIIDLENDNGIAQITYKLADFDYCDSPMDVPFEKTSPMKIWSLKAIGIRNPSPTKPFYAREGDRTYLYGIELVSVDFVEMWLYTAIDPTRQLDLDEEIPIAEDQISILNYRVLSLVRFGLLIGSDKVNDGSDIKGDRNKTALSQTQIGEAQQPTQPQQE